MIKVLKIVDSCLTAAMILWGVLVVFLLRNMFISSILFRMVARLLLIVFIVAQLVIEKKISKLESSDLKK